MSMERDYENIKRMLNIISINIKKNIEELGQTFKDAGDTNER